MSGLITTICKLKDGYTIRDNAIEVLTTLGKGGNPDALVIEDFVGYTNCPTLGSYFRASFDEAYAAALQYIKDNGGAQTCEIIDIEWDGQKMFYVEVDPAVGPEPLGMISNCAVYRDPVEVEA